MTLPVRIPVAIAVAIVAVAGLAGCGGDSAAGTAACRTYALGGGAGDRGLIADLSGAVAAGNWDAGPLLAEVSAVRSGAERAGLVKGLSTADYRLFRNVVTASANVGFDVAPTDSSRNLDSTVIASLQTAVDAVHKRCD